jgi:hypothetical protein
MRGRQSYADIRAARSLLALAFVLSDSRFHDFLHEGGGQGFIDWKMKRPFGCSEVFELSFKSIQHARTHGKQTAMLRKRTERNQRPFVLKRRNSVADGLGSLSRIADRITARTLFKVLRAGSGTPARYSSTVFGTPAFAFFMRAILQKPLCQRPPPTALACWRLP